MNGHQAMDVPAIRHPRIEIRQLSDDYAEFILSGTNVAMANALRRIIIAEVCVKRRRAGRTAPHHHLLLLVGSVHQSHFAAGACAAVPVPRAAAAPPSVTCTHRSRQ